MGILTLVLLTMISVSVRNALQMQSGKVHEPDDVARRIAYTRSVGLFAMIFGLLGQLIGLFSAFQAIELGDVNVSPTLLAAGFKISMITTIYGALIYAIALLISFGMSMVFTRR